MKENQHEQIPIRILELREILEKSPEEAAEAAGISVELYKKYESGELDIPISALYAIAAGLKTDVTVLITGEDPKMDSAAVCRKGKGVHIERYPGYEFSSLAYNFKGRTIEPLLVFLDPNKAPAKPVSHNGQEFNYILEGCVKLIVNRSEYLLNAGDSVYFDARIPHAQCAVDGPAQFLTIIQE